MKVVFSLFILVLASCSAVFAQEAYQAPKLSDDAAWSLIIVPDTQTYVTFSRNQGILEMMTAWIAENAELLKIGFVCQVGDLVNRNNFNETNAEGNQTSTQQWEAVSTAFKRLDGRVPYVVVPGNHDYGIGNTTANVRSSELKKYFTVDRDISMGHMIECFDNADGEKTLENAAYEFEVPDGKKYLVLCLEFLPRDAVLDWALSVAKQAEYQEHIGIVVTHSYLLGHDRKNELIPGEKHYKIQEDGNAGANIWKKLVAPAGNIRFVLCGHISKEDDITGAVGYSKMMNDAGKPVHQILFDTQALGGGWSGNGGDGWLQIMEFGKDGQTIHIKTFSPLFAISPTTRQFAWYHSDITDFSIKLDE